MQRTRAGPPPLTPPNRSRCWRCSFHRVPRLSVSPGPARSKIRLPPSLTLGTQRRPSTGTQLTGAEPKLQATNYDTSAHFTEGKTKA